MHLNKCVLIGRIGERGVKLTYSSEGTPTCSFWLDVDEPGKSGQLFTSYVPVEIVGKHAEDAAATLEPGDEVLIDGRLRYRSTVDPKTKQKTGRLVVSTWFFTKASPTPTSAPG